MSLSLIFRVILSLFWVFIGYNIPKCDIEILICLIPYSYMYLLTFGIGGWHFFSWLLLVPTIVGLLIGLSVNLIKYIIILGLAFWEEK